MELAQIGADVYACLQPDTGLGASNSGFVNVDGGLVVDTMWDLPRTRNMIDLYATVSQAPARRLVNTHHNGDHCWGNQLFAETGTEIMGHRLCAEWFTKEASPELFVALCEADEVAPPLDGFARSLRAFDFHDIVLTPPTTLLDGDTVLDLDGVEAHLLYVGPAHTPGDVVVHLPAESIVFTGDILFHRCTPIGWEGTFDNWIAALDRIEALDPATVVPGHGPAGHRRRAPGPARVPRVRPRRGEGRLRGRAHHARDGSPHRPRPVRALDRARASGLPGRPRLPRALGGAVGHAGRHGSGLR